jgi:hypothetical protein
VREQADGFAREFLKYLCPLSLGKTSTPKTGVNLNVDGFDIGCKRRFQNYEVRYSQLNVLLGSHFKVIVSTEDPAHQSRLDT